MRFLQTKNIIKILPIFLVCFFPRLVFADLDTEFRKNFADIVENFCHSGIDYDLDRDFTEVRAEFHATINYVFNDAISKSTNASNDQAKDAFSDKTLPSPLQKITFDSSCVADEDGHTPPDCHTLDQLISKQKSNGLESNCKDTGYKSVESSYSACKVAETVWTEFCGYEKFIWAKKRDDTTDFKEIEKLIQSEELNGVYIDFLDTKKEKLDVAYDFEMKKSREAVLQMIQLYQKFEQNYRIHSLLVVVYEEFLKTKEKLKELLDGVQKWPKKFRNSSAKNCS
ncbi:MAG: hypothetical protein OEL89_02690 [Candidatus Peregrinibacteria bacterium]|nr:hypothetical protein [Candidatus Peregrinibacteria bacterium]